jgi:AcrR family transcriptional regulator
MSEQSLIEQMLIDGGGLMPNKQTSSRSERRAAARRQQILDGAAQVFADKGFARATTKEIAQSADVSEGTIYNYFDSKEDLLIGLMGRVAEMQLAGAGLTISDKSRDQLGAMADSMVMREAMAHDLREFFENSFRWRQSFVAEHRPMLQALLAEMLVNPEFRVEYSQRLVDPFITQFERQVARRISAGDVRPVDVSLAVRFLFAVNLGMLGLLIMGDSLLEEKWESEELVQGLTNFVLRGISSCDESR